MTAMPIYLDAASTTPCAPEVVAAMAPCWHERFGNPAAQGTEGRRAAVVVRAAKEDIAALIGAGAEGITLTSGASEANALAILGAAAAARGGVRREILVSAIEHDSIMGLAPQLGIMGFAVKTIPVDAQGIVTPAALQSLLSPQVFLVSVIAAGHETGVLQDIPALCRAAQASGALFHTDAVQAAGKIPLQAAAWGVDMISLCAHKIYGPQGIGALYVRPSPPLKIMPLWGSSGGQALRGGTVPLALAAGFGAACRLAAEKMQSCSDNARACRASFLDVLMRSGVDFEVNEGAMGVQLPHILSIHLRGIDAADMMIALTGQVSFSTAAACRSAAGKTSAVLAAMGQDAVRAAQSIRLSFGADLTPEAAAAAAGYIARYVCGGA